MSGAAGFALLAAVSAMASERLHLFFGRPSRAPAGAAPERAASRASRSPPRAGSRAHLERRGGVCWMSSISLVRNFSTSAACAVACATNSDDAPFSSGHSGTGRRRAGARPPGFAVGTSVGRDRAPTQAPQRWTPPPPRSSARRRGDVVWSRIPQGDSLGVFACAGRVAGGAQHGGEPRRRAACSRGGGTR